MSDRSPEEMISTVRRLSAEARTLAAQTRRASRDSPRYLYRAGRSTLRKVPDESREEFFERYADQLRRNGMRESRDG